MPFLIDYCVLRQNSTAVTTKNLSFGQYPNLSVEIRAEAL
jgi:hypothetical protein